LLTKGEKDSLLRCNLYLCFVVASQSEDETVSLLQNLADMDITYKALQVKLTF